jgi:zinc protease
LTSLREAGPTPDELDRVKRPLIEARLKAQQSNAYWLSMIGNSQTEPRRLDIVRTSIPDFQAITSAEVRDVARRYLDPNGGWKLVARAALDQATAARAPAPSPSKEDAASGSGR